MWLADHSWWVIVFVGVAMIALGIVYLWDRALVRAAAIGNLLMLGCFIALLTRSNPVVLIIDIPMMILALFIWLRQRQKQPGSILTKTVV